MGFQCEVISELFIVELAETYTGARKKIKRKFLCWDNNINMRYFVPFILALAGGLMTGLRPYTVGSLPIPENILKLLFNGIMNFKFFISEEIHSEL